MNTAGSFGGHAYAIPIATAARVTQQIVTGKASPRVHIGATAFLAIQVQGTTVADVVPGSPAEAAGLKPGIVIISIGGKRVAGEAGITSAVLAHKPGQVVTVVYRDETGSRRTARVRLATGPPQKRLVPPSSDETAERDQADQDDDEPEPEAPDERDDDPDDHEDPAGADPADSAAPPSVECHDVSFRRVRRPRGLSQVPQNGLTSIVPNSATGCPAAISTASSRLSASMMSKPPRISFVSANGPSVTSFFPSRTRTARARRGGAS